MYNEQPQPGQPLRIDFNDMLPSLSSGTYPESLHSPESSNAASYHGERSKAGKRIVTWAPESTSFKSIPSDARSQCSDSSKRRTRLQRRRCQEYPQDMEHSKGLRPLKLGQQMIVDEGTIPRMRDRDRQLKPPKKYPPTPLPPGFIWGSEEQPLRPLHDLAIPPVPSPLSLSRRNTVESRYSLDSAFNSPDSPTISRSDSLYRKAVLALPRSAQFFLDSLDENPPKPPAPLKIRPPSKASTVSRRQGTWPSNQCQSGFEGPREWEMGWEDFDTILDEWQSGIEDNDTNALCVASPTSVLVPALGPHPNTLGHWKSKWSDTSSGWSRDSASAQCNDLAVPPLAHIPDLEPDHVSNASSPSPREVGTPFSQRALPSFPYNPGASHSHLSLCLAEPRG